MRRNFIRLALVILMVALGFGLYILGKEHKIFLDNKDVLVSGTELKSENTFNVFVDGQAVGEIKKGKRKVAYSPGPWHKIKAIEILPDGTTRQLERKFTLSAKDTATINLPALFYGNGDGWLNKEVN